MDCPEPEQAVVGSVGPVDSRVDVFLNMSPGHPDHDDGGSGDHLKVSGAVSAAEQEGDIGHHGPRHSADTAHTPGRVL